MSNTITWEEFEKVDLRVGTITRIEDNDKAKKPAYKVWVDLGAELGIKQASAQITHLYSKDDLIGKQVICVANFEPKRVAGFKSEVLITGFFNEDNVVIISQPERAVPNGAKLY